MPLRYYETHFSGKFGFSPIEPNTHQMLKGSIENRAKMFRRMVYVVWATILIYVPIHQYFGAYISVLALSLGVAVLTPLTLLLNRFGYSNTARFLFIFSCNSYIYFGSLGYRHMIAAEYYFIPAAILPILIFEFSEVTKIITLIFVTLGFWALMIFGPIEWHSTTWIAQTAPFEFFRIINFVGAFGVTALFIVQFVITINQLKDFIIFDLTREGRWYQTVTGLIKEGLIIFNDKGEIVSHNSSAKAILGITDNIVIGRKTSEFQWRVFREDGSELTYEERPQMVAIKTEKSLTNQVLQIRNPDGRSRWLRVDAIPFKENNKLYVITTFTNISELKREQEELLSNRSLLSNVLDNLPVMVFAKDYNDGLKFKLFNKFGANLIGVGQEMLIGKSDRDFFPKDQAEFFVQKDKEVFAQKKDLLIEKEVVATPNGSRWLRTHKVPTYKSDGKPDLLIGISTDITTELETRAKLEEERAISLQSAKMASLGELSAGVAHEINNPLTVILLNLTLAERSGDDIDKLKQKLAIVTKSAQRIEKIILGLKKFSRLSQGQIRNVATISVIVNEALQLVEPKLKQYSIRFESVIDANIEIYCDSLEIEQVVINLLNNSIDAIRGQDQPWVKIEAESSDNEITLRFIDSGHGISKEIEDKIFQPFFTTKPAGEGTGLGLSITKGILDGHKSTISINRSFQNTCFEIRFPNPKKVINLDA